MGDVIQSYRDSYEIGYPICYHFMHCSDDDIVDFVEIYSGKLGDGVIVTRTIVGNKLIKFNIKSFDIHREFNMDNYGLRERCDGGEKYLIQFTSHNLKSQIYNYQKCSFLISPDDALVVMENNIKEYEDKKNKI